MAALILGSLVLGTGSRRGRGEREVAPAAGLAAAAVPDGGLQGTIVARIIGTKDCRWADPRTAATVGQAVAVGRKFALASGKLEIAYNIGDRVALEGPATFEVDSLHSGRLSAGKLTFRSITVGLDGPLNELARQGLYQAADLQQTPVFRPWAAQIVGDLLPSSSCRSIRPAPATRHCFRGPSTCGIPTALGRATRLAELVGGAAQGDVTHYFAQSVKRARCRCPFRSKWQAPSGTKAGSSCGRASRLRPTAHAATKVLAMIV